MIQDYYCLDEEKLEEFYITIKNAILSQIKKLADSDSSGALNILAPILDRKNHLYGLLNSNTGAYFRLGDETGTVQKLRKVQTDAWKQVRCMHPIVQKFNQLMVSKSFLALTAEDIETIGSYCRYDEKELKGYYAEIKASVLSEIKNMEASGSNDLLAKLSAIILNEESPIYRVLNSNTGSDFRRGNKTGTVQKLQEILNNLGRSSESKEESVAAQSAEAQPEQRSTFSSGWFAFLRKKSSGKPPKPVGNEDGSVGNENKSMELQNFVAGIGKGGYSSD